MRSSLTNGSVASSAIVFCHKIRHLRYTQPKVTAIQRGRTYRFVGCLAGTSMSVAHSRQSMQEISHLSALDPSILYAQA